MVYSPGWCNRCWHHKDEHFPYVAGDADYEEGRLPCQQYDCKCRSYVSSGD